MKKAARIVASLILAGAMAAPAFAGFEFHGYGRAGVLFNQNGGVADAGGGDNGTFNYNWGHKPFTHNLGRLGNENDNYFEGVLQNNFGAGKVSGSTVARLAYKDHNYSSWINRADEAEFGVRELYTEMKGLDFAPNAKVWAGKRFYGREDVHINDWFLRIMDGTGAGVEMPVGPGTLSAAFIACNDLEQGDYNLTDSEDGGKVQKNYNLRYAFPALDGTIDLEANLITRVANPGDADDGIGLYAGYGRKDYYMVAPGFSKTIVQYGTSLGADLGTSYGFTGKDADALRITTYGVAEIGEQLKMMSNFVYESSTDKYGTGWDSSWYAMTVRPEYSITRNFAMVAEFGIEDMMKQGGNTIDEGMSYKLTLAPTITLDNTSFWNRPQLRAFVTYGGWGEDAGSFGGDQYANEESGVTYGAQMEVWF